MLFQNGLQLQPLTSCIINKWIIIKNVFQSFISNVKDLIDIDVRIYICTIGLKSIWTIFEVVPLKKVVPLTKHDRFVILIMDRLQLWETEFETPKKWLCKKHFKVLEWPSGPVSRPELNRNCVEGVKSPYCSKHDRSTEDLCGGVTKMPATLWANLCFCECKAWLYGGRWRGQWHRLTALFLYVMTTWLQCSICQHKIVRIIISLLLLFLGVMVGTNFWSILFGPSLNNVIHLQCMQELISSHTPLMFSENKKAHITSALKHTGIDLHSQHKV